MPPESRDATRRFCRHARVRVRSMPLRHEDVDAARYYDEF